MTRIAYTPGMTLDEPLVNAEVYGANPQRVSTQAGGSPTDIQLLNVDLGVEARHVVIHDVHNVGWWANAPGVVQDRTLYNVTVYNVGWQGKPDGDRPDGGHGQALYTQNYASGGTRVIDTCIFLAGFSLPGKVYGTNSEVAPGGWVLHVVQNADGGYDLKPSPSNVNTPRPWDFDSPRNKLANYDIRHSIFGGSRFIIGNEGKSPVGAHNITIDDCVFQAWLQFGYQGFNGRGWIVNSLFLSGLSVQCYAPDHNAMAYNLDFSGNPLVNPRSWDGLAFADNTLIAERDGAIGVVYPGDLAHWTWDYNTYYSTAAKPFVVTRLMGFARDANGYPLAQIERRLLTFDEWRALTGFDANSEFHAGLPTEPIRRSYPIDGLATPARNVAYWHPQSALSASLTAIDDANASILYPPPPPLNWDGVAPSLLPVDGRIAVWTEIDAPEGEPEIVTELRRQVATLQDENHELAIRAASLRSALDTETAAHDALKQQTEADRGLVSAARALWSASITFAEEVQK